VVVAIAATFLSLTYEASAMVFALLLGMALNFLAEEGRCRPGIQLAATHTCCALVSRCLGCASRVGMLLPVCLGIGVMLHLRSSETAHSAPLFPWFALAFAALVAIGSMAWIPSVVVGAGSELSRWCLVTAIAAIGMKTSLKSLMVMGWRPVMLVVAESLVIAVLVMGAVMATGHGG